jgi:hypothetical protein
MTGDQPPAADVDAVSTSTNDRAIESLSREVSGSRTSGSGMHVERSREHGDEQTAA